MTTTYMEVFKFISWPFLIGVPLRDSWSKVSLTAKNIVLVILALLYMVMAWLYIFSPDQLCNNYLIVDQRTLGWSFFTRCIMFFNLCCAIIFY